MSTSDQIALINVWVTAGLGVAALSGTIVAIVLSAQANGRESRRDAQQDRDRVDRWLAEFIVNATHYWVACEEWYRRVQEMQIRDRMGVLPSDTRPPAPPSSGQMLAALDAARLVSRDEVATSLQTVSDYVNAVLRVPYVEQRPHIHTVTDAVRNWRSGAGDLSVLAVLPKPAAPERHLPADEQTIEAETERGQLK